MGFDFQIFNDNQLQESFVEWLVDEHSIDISNHFSKLWDYYHNTMQEIVGISGVDSKLNESSRNYRQSQERGLPARITGIVHTGMYGGKAVSDIQRKEVVIENDISWRINAMVDFLFGKGVRLVSKSPDSQKRTEIESILKAVFSANGAISFFQDMAVLGGVYGFVDCVIRPSKTLLTKAHDRQTTTDASNFTPSGLPSFDKALELASAI